jgi:hypothetical protein
MNNPKDGGFHQQVYIKRTFNAATILSMHSCGECWIENDIKNGIFLGCEKCSNDDTFQPFTQFVLVNQEIPIIVTSIRELKNELSNECDSPEREFLNIKWLIEEHNDFTISTPEGRIITLKLN